MRERLPPLLVIDWNIFRSMARHSEELPTRYGALIADAMIHEIVGSDNPAGFVEKLNRILTNSSHKQLFVGKYWEKIAAMEQPGYACRMHDVIDWSISSDLQSDLATPIERWSARIPGSPQSPEHEEYERLKQTFVQNCNAFATEAKRSFPSATFDKMRSQPELLLETIRRPDIAVETALVGRTDLRTSDWRRALTRFPDKHALGRWWRIVVWYALQRAIGEGKAHDSFENNWDDAHYGFLASYTGRLVTRDIGLTRMVRAICPSVKITDHLPP